MARAETEVLDTHADATAAAAGAPVKRAYVRDMFSDIAPRYDLLNRVLSAGIDRSWRRTAIAALGWERRPNGHYLDVCAGTMDVSAALSCTAGFEGRVLAADFAEPMLRLGRAKGRADAIAPVVADALSLPLPDACCDGALVAFGIRNVASIDAALREVLRTLSSGSRFVILELSTPSNALLRAAYLFYFSRILPVIGGIISGHATAYRYLPQSVMQFPEGDALAARMRSAGFVDVSWRPLTLGIAALHVGTRP